MLEMFKRKLTGDELVASGQELFKNAYEKAEQGLYMFEIDKTDLFNNRVRVITKREVDDELVKSTREDEDDRFLAKKVLLDNKALEAKSFMKKLEKLLGDD